MMLLRRIVELVIVFLLASTLTACAFIKPSPRVLLPQSEQPRKLVVFFDGTANDERSDTNIQKLHALVSLQKGRDINISTFYIDGVGANGKVAGMATGWGIGYRNRLAYQYLAENYRAGDTIYLFGFSRGAYSARVVASMLYFAGLPGKLVANEMLRKDFADIVYDAYKGDYSPETRRQRIGAAIAANKLPALGPVNVSFLGLWDTVEALGLPDYKENTDLPNTLYGDQLCNVKQAAHAMAADDDRARIFTPILLTTQHLLEPCTPLLDDKTNVTEIRRRLNKIVDEVWFYGAHADVGGGYKNGLISGVSLNWMIEKISKHGLVPKGTAVPESRAEQAHDPEHGLVWGTLYHQRSRNLRKYAETSPYDGKLRVHESLIERLGKSAPEPNEMPWKDRERGGFPECFWNGYEFKGGNMCMLEKVSRAVN